MRSEGGAGYAAVRPLRDRLECHSASCCGALSTIAAGIQPSVARKRVLLVARGWKWDLTEALVQAHIPLAQQLFLGFSARGPVPALLTYPVI